MAQQLKAEVQERIVRAAEEELAHLGFRGATMATIARRADVATGNIYRYFGNKEALFEAIVPDSFAQQFLRLLKKRVSSLQRAPELTHLPNEARRDGEDLLAFWVEHRLKVIILLDGSAESPQEGFVNRFIEALMKPTLETFQAESGRPLAPTVHFTLRNIFEATVKAIVAILQQYETEEGVRHAFAAFWSYQLAGLAGLRQWVRSC